MPEGNAEGDAEAKAPAEAGAGGAQAPQAGAAEATDSSAKDDVATAKEAGTEAPQDAEAGEGAAAAQAEGTKRSREGDDDDDVPAKAAKTGKAEGLQLGPKHFDNPERARVFFSYLCREGPFNILLNEYEHLMLTDLLRLHPRARAKIGPGVRGFKIKELKRTKCIFAVHTDGTEIDFSYIKCLEFASGVDLKRAGARQG